ncbi:unnamed protein product [Oreochromis niloticus]|nr:unnamed protein product [Mustela putorius furo]
MPATPAKVPKYNGLTPLEPYLSQVRLAARHNGWRDEEAATHLALALEGDALQVLLDLAPSEQHELQALTIALERRFGQRHSTDQSREQLTNRSLTGERTDMWGKKPLRIRVKDLELVHDFWLADIQDQCIIGLDLLTRWGACVDTAKLAITLGTETLALQCGEKQGTRDCRQTRLVQHTIDTGSAQPICLRPRQLPLAKQQGERAQEARGVATARATAGGGGRLSLTMQQLKQEQEADATLVQVGAWLEAARRPGWTGVSGQGPEGKDLPQLLVPRSLRSQVLELVHGSVGASHYGNPKTLRRLRGQFYWPGCRRDVELHVHCCDTCTARKGPTQCPTGPLQQHRVGAPMERVGGDVLGPFPVPEAGNRRVSVARDCYRRLRERPRVVHDYTRQAQVSAGVRQKGAWQQGLGVLPGSQERGVPQAVRSLARAGGSRGAANRSGVPDPHAGPRARGGVAPGQALTVPPAPAAARAGGAGGTPGSHPSDSSPAGRDRPARRRKTHGHLQDFVLGNGVVGDD